MTTQQWANLIGSTAIDSEGNKIGKVGQVFLNDDTGEPAWVTVSTGLFGTRESFAPLAGAQEGEGEVQLAVTKALVKDAPNIDTHGQLAGDDVDALYDHYEGYTGSVPGQAGGDGGYGTTGTPEAGAGSAGAGYAGREQAGAGYADEDGRTRRDGTAGLSGDDAMTRSEERLRVGTERVPAARVRLRKYIVTEQVTKTVPVSHEEVRIEREPITDANRGAALDGPDITEDEHEVILNQERPVVDKETVPVERVRLGTDTVTEQREVNEQVRKERIEDPDVDTGGRRDGAY
jgi:uncharacterized protein (TIGR02271 family)